MSLLARYAELQDRRLARRDSEYKVVGPFEWGLEYLELDPAALDPARVLREFAARQIGASARYFSSPGGNEFRLRSNELVFPSALETETPENNLVHCRLFERRQRKLVVIIIPHWGGRARSYDRLGNILRLAGISAVRLSLPFHDARHPPTMPFPTYMVSSNIGRTIRSSRQAVLDVRRLVDWLVQRGYRHVCILGASLGSSIAFLAAAHDERIRSAVFLLVASSFARVIWSGSATIHIREAIEDHLSVEELDRIWSLISPISYVKLLGRAGFRSLVLSGDRDTVFRPELTDEMLQGMRRESIPVTHKALSCGHYSIGTLPFTIPVLYSLLRFLRKLD